MCQIREADLDLSGFPCVDWSPSGLQAGVYGHSFGVLVALLAYHRAMKSRIVMLENVPEFEVGVLRLLAGDLYEVHEYYVEPRDIGAGYLSRLRIL